VPTCLTSCAGPGDLISLTGLLPIWLPKGALPAGVTVSWCGQIRCDLHGLHRRRSGTSSVAVTQWQEVKDQVKRSKYGFDLRKRGRYWDRTSDLLGVK
jgi:hypothetical protein